MDKKTQEFESQKIPADNWHKVESQFFILMKIKKNLESVYTCNQSMNLKSQNKTSLYSPKIENENMKQNIFILQNHSFPFERQ